MQSFVDIVKTVVYISKGIELNMPRLILRAVRQNISIRKYVTSDQLQLLLKKYIPANWETLAVMKNLAEKVPSQVYP